MDIKAAISKTWKLAAMIGIVWAIITNVIGLIPVIGGIISLLLAPIGLIIAVVIGYLGAQKVAGGAKTDMANGAVGGAIAGIIASLAGSIISIPFALLGLAGTAGMGMIGGDPTGGAIGAGIGLIAMIIAIPFAMIFGAILGLVGGVIYAAIKK